MKAVLQRVTQASVSVDGAVVGAIDQGLMVLVGMEPGDGQAELKRMVERLLSYRVFGDEQGRMNNSLSDIGGGLLLVPQFTLAADTRKGNRPGFSTAAPPERADALFTEMVALAGSRHNPVAAGQFGADMAVSLTNDGPVTFLLEV